MKRKHWIHIGLLALLRLGLCACAPEGGLGIPSTPSTPYPPPGFAHRQSSMAVELFWNCTRPTPSALLLQGVVVNVVESEVRSLEFTLSGVDARGAAVSEANGATRSFVLGTTQSTPIQLELQTTGSEVRFDLFYQYQSPYQGGSELTGLRGGAVAVRLVANPAFLLAQGMNRLMVRDVCSESLHRAH